MAADDESLYPNTLYPNIQCCKTVRVYECPYSDVCIEMVTTWQWLNCGRHSFKVICVQFVNFTSVLYGTYTTNIFTVVHPPMHRPAYCAVLPDCV